MFTTSINIPESPIKIGHENNIMTLGSCFSENIGERLTNLYFSVDRNPFGVLYNPVSIRNSIYCLLENKLIEEEDLFYHHSLWHSFSHSSLFSGISKESVLKNINERISSASFFIRNTKFLFITFGTAWVYEHVRSGKVVSNCHKLPAKDFIRYRLSTEDILSDYTELIWKLNSALPDLHIVFTVSPIRHWKDGARENNISKGILHIVIDALQKQFKNVMYFPAYEILLDELRDYRYYASDMLHPSELAVNYIWKKFSGTYFSEKTSKINSELKRFNADLSHRPLHADSEEYTMFLKKAEEKKEALIQKYPFLKNRFNNIQR